MKLSGMKLKLFRTQKNPVKPLYKNLSLYIIIIFRKQKSEFKQINKTNLSTKTFEFKTTFRISEKTFQKATFS